MIIIINLKFKIKVKLKNRSKYNQIIKVNIINYQETQINILK